MAVARNNRHNAAFVVGSVLGAVAGAAVALWKTPYTGEELRAKLTGGGTSHETSGAQTYVASPSPGTTVREQRSIKDKVISGVEKTLAPVVGVELGKTANASGPTTMDSGEIKVSPEYGTTMLRHPHDWKDDTDSAPSTGAASEKIGLSMDKVDAKEWAAAYGTSADTTATSATDSATSEPASSEAATTRLRRQRSFGESREDDATSSGAASEKIGLSMDKVDAEEWAAAYGTSADTTATSAADPATSEPASSEAATTRLRRQRSWGESREDDTTSTGSETPTFGLSVDRVDAEEWAAAYGTEAPSGSTGQTRSSEPHTTARSERTSKEAEAEEKTRAGAKPAFPGSDETGHQPADRTAPDTSVADVDRNAAERASGTDLAMEEAASVEDLTTPQVDRVPDSLQATDERAYHPFPKLGGKEDRS
jgi:hypothetical protein